MQHNANGKGSLCDRQGEAGLIALQKCLWPEGQNSLTYVLGPHTILERQTWLPYLTLIIFTVYSPQLEWPPSSHPMSRIGKSAGVLLTLI